jgi:hypothetical protein
LHVSFETCPPKENPLRSGEPEPIVHVKLDEPPLTLIDPFPSAVIEKSPAIASDELVELEEVDELDEVDELTDWPAVPGDDEPVTVDGCRRSIETRTPSSHTILTVEPAK